MLSYMLIDSPLEWGGFLIVKDVLTLRYSGSAELLSVLLQDESKGCGHH